MIYKFEGVLFVMNNCVFCRIVAGKMEAERVFESENFIVIRDAFPKVKGHLLVVSKGHYKDFMEMPRGLYDEMLGVVRSVVLQEKIRDFNLVVNRGEVAGQVVWHFHLHIMPRVTGDGFKFGI
jgi:histidine triad (HIT) family protein